MKIIKIFPDSLAETIGLQPGDRLLKINGKRVQDEIDYKLTSIINKILVSEIYRDSLSEKISSLSKPDASKIIVNEIKMYLK